MAIAFSKIKQGFELLDYFHSGKYEGCRVNSIVESDPKYIRYTFDKYMFNYSKEVLDIVDWNIKYQNDQRYEAEEVRPFFQEQYPVTDGWLDDIPF